MPSAEILMIDLRNICSLSDFQRNTREHIRRLERTRRPNVLTVNGSAKVVVQDVESYQELLDAVSHALEARECERESSGEPESAGEQREPTREQRESTREEPDPVVEAYKAGIDRSLLRQNLRRSFQERVDGLVALRRLAAEARRAGRGTGNAS